MVFTPKQRGVARGMATGAICTIVAIAGAAAWYPAALLPSDNTVARIAFALKWDLLPAVCLLAAVAQLARHRFFTPEDIDGGGLTPGTARAHVLQSIVQNTLEQAVLASLAYLIWAVTMPHAWLASIPVAAVLFLLGRLLFFRGYERGAAARAAGFALTFYPSVLMLAASVVMLGRQIGAG
jgi:uncharacterized membrane protein YecN with MAPEG domain